MTSKIFFCNFFKISKNKTVEFQSGVWEHWSYFQFQLTWSRKTDHAGFLFYIELFGLNFNFEIHDDRHWDWESDCWEGSAPPKTQETHPRFFNEDGSEKKFVSPGVYTTECD